MTTTESKGKYYRRRITSRRSREVVDRTMSSVLRSSDLRSLEYTKVKIMSGITL